jgi:hypothetical protein
MSLDFGKESLEIKIVSAADRVAQPESQEESKEENFRQQISYPDRRQKY